MNASSRCGFIALVGRPNVGKSTLLNHLIGEKLAITSRRPQTTRHRITGICTRGADQFLFVDTPGLEFTINRPLNRYMRRLTGQALADVDIAVMVVDRNHWKDSDEHVAVQIEKSACTAVLAINKVDLMKDKTPLLPFIDQIRQRNLFQAIVITAALKNYGLADLFGELSSRLPKSPHLFPPDYLTDKTDRFRICETIREQVIRQLGDELPYQTAIELERLTRTEKAITIHAAIIAERPSQKAMLIGRGGRRIKAIRSRAESELATMLESRLELSLWVKVRKSWSAKIEQLKALGYDDS